MYTVCRIHIYTQSLISRKEKYTFPWENRTEGRRLNGFTRCYVRDNRRRALSHVRIFININAFKTNRVKAYFECIVHAICCQTFLLFNGIYSRYIQYNIHVAFKKRFYVDNFIENTFLHIFMRVCVFIYIYVYTGCAISRLQ